MSTERPERALAAGAGGHGVQSIESPVTVPGPGAQPRPLRGWAGQAARLFAARRTRVAYATAGIAAVGLLWTALIVRDLQVQIASEVAAAQHDLENVTEIGVHALELAVRGADLLLIDLRDEWLWHRWHFPGLVKIRERHPAIGFEFDITVLDRNGRVIFATSSAQHIEAAPGRQRLWARLREAATDTLSISAARASGGRPAMDLARRLTTPDGEFDGVVICSVPSDYLRTQFAGVRLEPGTTLTGVRDDGRVLVQLTSARGGTLVDSSAVLPAAWPGRPDGTPRGGTTGETRPAGDRRAQLIASRDAHEYPFTFVVAKPRASLDAMLARLRSRYAAVAMVLSAALLAVLWRFVRQQELRDRAAREQADHLRALTQAQAALAASECELRELSSHNLALKEAERRRVAQEIHDELGQRLTVHRIDLSLLPQAVRDNPARDLPIRIAAMKSDVDAMLRIARDIAGQLRPAALDIGLAPAVESMLNEVDGKLGIRCELDNRLPPDFATDDTRATTAFRIVQEAVTNAVRHAQPTLIRVLLDRSPDRLLLRVDDDGCGFDQQAAAAGFGVKGMRERARALGGALRVQSIAGQGTTVEAEVPLHGEIEAGTRIPAPASMFAGG